MSQEINVLSRTQVIVVDPISKSVSVINAGAIGPAGPPGLSGGLASILSIETPILLFAGLAPSSSFSWTEVDIECYAAMFVRFTVNSTDTASYAIKVTSKPLGAGEEMFAAAGMPFSDYKLSWPWWYNSDDIPREKKMYIGIKNTGGVASTFSIIDLRGYSLED